MTYRYSVSYLIKEPEPNGIGKSLLVDKRVQFPTLRAAILFSRQLSNNEHVVGKPLLEDAA